MKTVSFLGKIFYVVGILLIIMLVYLLFVPPYTHKFVVGDIYNSFFLSRTELVHERWATRADICLWEYLTMSSSEKCIYELSHIMNNELSGDYVIHNMMLHKTFLIINSILGALFIGVGIIFTQYRNKIVIKTVGIQNIMIDRTAKGDNIIGYLGFIFSLIALSFCWISIIGLILWSIGFILSLWGIFKSPRIASITGIIISLLNIVLIVILANHIPAMF